MKVAENACMAQATISEYIWFGEINDMSATEQMVSSQCVCNPFIFIRKKPRVISSEGFSALEKNTVICLQRDVLPIQSGII
jgi:hypothetical protein